MKRFKSLIFTFLALTMIFLLSSCAPTGKEEESTEAEKAYTADELFELIDQKMDSYDSYEASVEMTMNVTMSDVEVNTTATGVEIRRGIVTDNYEFYTQLNTVVNSPALKLPQKINNIEAYFDGNYYIYDSNAGRKIYSAMSKEDAKEYAEKDATELSVFGDCVNKELKKNDDGTYELTFSGYTAEAIADILEKTSIDSSELSHEVADVRFRIKANENLSVSEIEFSFEFEQSDSGEKLPEISVKMIYSKFDSAEIDPSLIEIEKYTHIGSFKVLFEIEDLLKARWEKEEGEFTLNVSQVVKLAGNSQENSETDKVVYGTNEYGYYYDIDADMNGTKYDISYTQGVQTVSSNGETKQAPQSEQEAREFVQSLVNSCQFSTAYVTNIKKISSDRYKFTLVPQRIYAPLIRQMGGEYKDVTQSVTVTIKDGEIVKIESEAIATGVVTSGNSFYTMTFTVTSNAEFDK